jgi:hypothetical protein
MLSGCPAINLARMQERQPVGVLDCLLAGKPASRHDSLLAVRLASDFTVKSHLKLCIGETSDTNLTLPSGT